MRPMPKSDHEGEGVTMPSTQTSFGEELKNLINKYLTAGAEPENVIEELTREANLIFGEYNLEIYLASKHKTE
jgi:hypothetical protein